jgi:hypothetical protein
MNKRNKRIREQVLDYLIGNFYNKENWVKEIDINDKNQDPVLSKEEISQLRPLLKNKLVNGQSILIRFSLVNYFHKRKWKNLPAMLINLKIEEYNVNCTCTMANKFGNHNFRDLPSISENLNRLNEILIGLETLLHINHRVMRYNKEYVNV